MPNIKPITFEGYSRKRWIRAKDFKFASRDMICAISAQEVLKATLGTPIGFFLVDGQFALVALQGLESNHNHFIAADGTWLGRYIPYSYWCYPFQVLKDENGKQVLCIDEDSGLVTDDSNESAEIFFDTEGNPSKKMIDLVDFLSGHANRLKATREICALLAQHKLIKPWQLKVQTAKGEIQLQDIYCIDEDRLNSLSATSLKELRNKDALIVAYGQLFSMLNVSLLAQQVRPDQPTPGPGSLSDEILFGGGDSGTISFDNL